MLCVLAFRSYIYNGLLRNPRPAQPNFSQNFPNSRDYKHRRDRAIFAGAICTIPERTSGSAPVRGGSSTNVEIASIIPALRRNH